MSKRLPSGLEEREQFFKDYTDLQRRLNRVVMHLEDFQAECFRCDLALMEQTVRKGLEELRLTV